VSVVGAILLLFGGLVGLVASWNAARPLIDPTRRYSPAWLPAMIVAEIAPFWMLVHLVTIGVGIGLGGWTNWGGRIGLAMLVASLLLLVWVGLRTVLAVRRLRRLVIGRVHGTTGRSRLIGIPVPTPPGVREAREIPWHPGLTLDLARPDDDRRDLPVIVYVHGGGWTGGDPRRQARDLYHTLALDGWATLAIRYPFTPKVSVEAQVEAVRAAIRWARAELAEHGVDATHVAVAGGSAGGHLATMAALTAQGDCERVDAVVGLYGVYDMANRNRLRAPWAKIRNEVMMETVADAPDRYRALSPIDQITARTPPMLLVHGTHDTLVPIGESEQFAALLAAAGRPVELVPVWGAQHAFDAVSSPRSRTVAAVIRTWLRENVLAP
jgi:acetyl esterase/lipase